MAAPARPVRAAAALLLATLAACSDGGEVRELRGGTREVAASPLGVPDLTSAERFGFRGMPAASAPSAGLTWTLPAGWTELPPAPPRTAGFGLPGGAECSLTVLPGQAGGLQANVNRWRSQLGLPPWEAERVAALPRDPLLGGQAVRVELPAPDDPAVADGQGTLGWILEERGEQPGQVVFVKAFGPAAALAAQHAELRALAASLGRGEAHAGHAHGVDGDDGDPHAGLMPPGADDPHAGLLPAGAVDPHAGLDGAELGSMAALLGGESGEAEGLAWTAPEGWQRAGPRPMRVVTLTPEGHPQTEVYVVVLPGTGGTVADNVDRWRGQLGLPSLAPGAHDALPTLEVLGTRAVLAELSGGGQGLTGLVCPLPGRTLFVKLTGPTDSVAAERERFVAFCRSLRY
jgi:hypothetical protein